MLCATALTPASIRARRGLHQFSVCFSKQPTCSLCLPDVMFSRISGGRLNSAAWTIVPIKITDELLMSALGQKRTLELSRAMSAYSVLLYHLLGELEATGSVQLGEGTHPPR